MLLTCSYTKNHNQEGRGNCRLSCAKGLDPCPAAGTPSCPPCSDQHTLPHEDHLWRSGVVITRYSRIVLPALRSVLSLQGDSFQRQNMAHRAFSSCCSDPWHSRSSCPLSLGPRRGEGRTEGPADMAWACGMDEKLARLLKLLRFGVILLLQHNLACPH